MRKTRKEIKVEIATYVDTHVTTRLVVDNQYKKTTNITDSNREAEIDFTNVGLVEFGIQTKTSLIDSIQETCRRQAIDDFTKCNDNNLIISLIINIGAESAIYNKESLITCRCQVNKSHYPNLGDIDYVSKYIVSLEQKIIYRSGQEVEEDIDIDYV